MKEKIRRILDDNMSRGSVPTGCKSLPGGILHYPIGSLGMYIANIVCGAIGINDIMTVAKLGVFIENSWRDQEPCEEQFDDIIECTVMLWKEYMNTKDDFGMPLIKKEAPTDDDVDLFAALFAKEENSN